MPTKTQTLQRSIETGHVKHMLIDVRAGSTPNPKSVAAAARALTERVQRQPTTGQLLVNTAKK